MNSNSKNSLKIGLALGSGSARGLTHIGVIRAIKDAGIQVDYIAGTSIGALIGAVFASGKIDSLQDAYLSMDWKKIAYFFDVVFPKSGIIDGNKVEDFIREYIHSSLIEDLPIPFNAIATDFDSGEEVVFKTGDVIEAVRASISIPGIFTPVRNNNRVLIDGGLVNPVPISTAQDMGADIVIAVDPNHRASTVKKSTEKSSLSDNGIMQKLSELGGSRYKTAMDRIEKKLKSLDDNPTLDLVREWLAEEPLPNIFEVLLNSINIMEAQISSAHFKINPPDLLIQPSLNDIRFLEFNRAEEIISIGYNTTQKKLAELPSNFFTKT